MEPIILSCIGTVEKFPGSPDVGDVIGTDWTWNGVVDHFGRDGVDGTDGTDGEDGDAGPRSRGDFYRSISGSSWSTFEANNATPGDNVISDTVTLYQSGGTYIETRTWQGTAWVVVDRRFDGNNVFPGTIIANALAANSVNLGSAVVTGTLTASPY